MVASLRALITVKSLASICRSLTSTMFSEPILRQSHTARQRQLNGKEYSVSLLGSNKAKAISAKLLDLNLKN